MITRSWVTAAAALAVMLPLGNAQARTFAWGEVEDFSSATAYQDIYTPSDIFTESWQSTGGWDGGPWMKLSLNTTPEGWEDDAGFTEIHFPNEDSTHVFVFWMQKVGTAYYTSLDVEEYKHVLVYSIERSGGGYDRPMVMNWHMGPGLYRIYTSCLDANGNGCRDEFGNLANDRGDDYPNHAYHDDDGPPATTQWAFFVFEVDHSAGSRNTLYIWTQDGTIRGESPYAASSDAIFTLPLDYARIAAYMEGATVTDPENAWIGIDYIGVSDTKPSPPAGFVTGDVEPADEEGPVETVVEEGPGETAAEEGPLETAAEDGTVETADAAPGDPDADEGGTPDGGGDSGCGCAMVL